MESMGYWIRKNYFRVIFEGKTGENDIYDFGFTDGRFNPLDPPGPALIQGL